MNIITQAPEVAGSALKAHKIDAHADFVPFAELFPFRGFARKIYDGAQANAPTFHGTLVDADYAKRYPEVVVAYLRAVIEANRLFAQDPEKYSQLIQKVTGIDAEVNYLFHGPLGLQTRDLTWKPEYRQATVTAIEHAQAAEEDRRRSGCEHLHRRPLYPRSVQAIRPELRRARSRTTRSNRSSPMTRKPASAITDLRSVTQVWVDGEGKVRDYASAQEAFAAVNTLERGGKKVRVVYVQDHSSGLKLFANQAWYVKDAKGNLAGFLLKENADSYAKQVNGKVVDFAAAKTDATQAVAAR